MGGHQDYAGEMGHLTHVPAGASEKQRAVYEIIILVETAEYVNAWLQA